VIDEASEIELLILLLLNFSSVAGRESLRSRYGRRAIEQFFNEGNLYALRELTLRRAAERIDEQMLAYMQTRAIPVHGQPERISLCLFGSGPLSERLVRTARRQATGWGPVDRHLCRNPGSLPAFKRGQGTAQPDLQLAEKLGATTVTLFGLNIASTVIDYARQHNITRIIIGKTSAQWQEYVFGSVVDQLIHDSGNIDIYVISSNEHIQQKIGDLDFLLPVVPPRDYLACIALVAAITLIGWLIKAFISRQISPCFTSWGCCYRVQERSTAGNFHCYFSVLAFDFFFIALPSHSG